MSYYNCDNPDEHKREGHDDFRHGGRYGYDYEKYHDHWDNDCNKAYHDGFDEARREHDRREEERQMEEAELVRQQREAAEEHAIREAEEAYYVNLQADYQFDPSTDT